MTIKNIDVVDTEEVIRFLDHNKFADDYYLVKRDDDGKILSMKLVDDYFISNVFR